MIRVLAVMAGLVGTASVAMAAEPYGPTRFDQFAGEIAAFAGREVLPGKPEGTLFVGSSSIRLWDVTGSFPARHPLNRGFGGATTPDVLHFYPQVVARYRPASVVVYVGENDIAAGADAETVARDVLTLLGKIRADNPTARIVYLSMKPSPSRWELWPRMGAVNATVRAQSGTKTFDYLDVASQLMDETGRPDPQYFARDGLHMNAAGYKQWTAAVDTYLGGQPTAPAVKTVVKTAATTRS